MVMVITVLAPPTVMVSVAKLLVIIGAFAALMVNGAEAWLPDNAKAVPPAVVLVTVSVVLV